MRKQGGRRQSEAEKGPQERLRGETGNISGEQPGCGKAEGTGQLRTGYGDRGRGGGQVPAEDG